MTPPPPPLVRARNGCDLPRLGQGTWRMGEDAARRSDELAALAQGLDLGLSLIDTAEMYGQGAAERLVGEAIRGRREEVFLVSKVLPENASYDGVLQACHASLMRLGTDRLDLYLLHWRGPHPVSATFEAFERLAEEGKIRFYGVSNFDLEDLRSLERTPIGPNGVANQVKYALNERGIEWSLLPWCEKNALAVMAYSPLGQGDLLHAPALAAVARRRGVAPAAVALAWSLRRPLVAAIAKAGTPAHARENAAALTLRLDEEDWAALDDAFPPPQDTLPLATA